MACFLAALLLPLVDGQTAPAQPQQGGGEQEIPPLEELVITTADGVRLAATFFPGPKGEGEGKETVPIILLHGQKGSRSDYGELASDLQAEGHAVLVPDLRCHGDSARRDDPRTAPSSARRPATYLGMARFDMEALKEFLRQENNKGELNIEKLCVVGAEMGASVAWNWAFFDWNHPPIGTVKLGQDVKALVLISPESTTPKLTLRVPPMPIAMVPLTDPLLLRANVFKYPRALDPRREISVAIYAGRGNPKSARDARRLHTMLKRFHPDSPAGDNAPKPDLFHFTFDTSLQGTKLLGVRGLNLDQHIKTFIEKRLASRSVPWQKRTNDPYAGRE